MQPHLGIFKNRDPNEKRPIIDAISGLAGSISGAVQNIGEKVNYKIKLLEIIFSFNTFVN